MSQDLVGKLVDAIQGWHADGHALLDQMFEAPSDKPLVIQMGDEELKLEGDAIKHFKVGLVVAQQIFKNLPFEASPCDGPSVEAVE